MRAVAERVLEVLTEAIGPEPAPLHAPTFTQDEVDNVVECVRSTFVSSVGLQTQLFEDGIRRITGAKHAVALVNGTAALHLGLLACGVRPGDEVVIPALTFAATANAVAYCGAYPLFADSSERDLGIDSEVLRVWLKRNTKMVDGSTKNVHTGRRVSALAPVHIFGHVCDVNALAEVAADFRLALVEDAAEALGSFRQGVHAGRTGVAGVLSFNGNKIVTTGGGGAIVTDRDDIASRARHLAGTARLPHAWEIQHDDVGFNYRMPALNAALGLPQLSRLETLVESKRRLHEVYRQGFSQIPGLSVFREPPECQSNYWLQALILQRGLEPARREILELTNANGYQTRPAWMPISDLPHFQRSPRTSLESTMSLSERIINLPSSPGLV